MNLLARQFLEADLLDRLDAATRGAGLEHGDLEVEITEMEAMTHLERAVEVSRDAARRRVQGGARRFRARPGRHRAHPRPRRAHDQDRPRPHRRQPAGGGQPGDRPVRGGAGGDPRHRRGRRGRRDADRARRAARTRLPDGPGLPVLAADHRRRDVDAAAALRRHPGRHGLVEPARSPSRSAGGAIRMLGCRLPDDSRSADRRSDDRRRSSDASGACYSTRQPIHGIDPHRPHRRRHRGDQRRDDQHGTRRAAWPPTSRADTP